LYLKENKKIKDKQNMNSKGNKIKTDKIKILNHAFKSLKIIVPKEKKSKNRKSQSIDSKNINEKLNKNCLYFLRNKK
jgi:spore cortex formation protein SpoVR/YcgB (stage V sporulation)